MRLIDADAIKKAIKDYGKGAINDGMKTLDPVDDIVALAGLPDFVPEVDAVPVVRCKNCVHYSLHDAAGGRYCEILRNESPIESGYCCYGERRSE